MFYNLKGICLRKLGRYSEALECFFTALDIDPNEESYQQNVKEVLKEVNVKCKINKQPNSTVKLIKKCNDSVLTFASEKSEVDDESCEEDVSVDKAKQDVEIDIYNLACELNLPVEEYCYNKGLTLYNLGNYNEVLEYINYAIRIDPYKVAYSNLKEMTLIKLGVCQYIPTDDILKRK
jgi:tetratricopeptide (TPR) repeat protein